MMKIKGILITENTLSYFTPNVLRALQYATAMHSHQSYGHFPYYEHLNMVIDILVNTGHDEEKYLVAGALHDIIEDTDTNYNDVKESFGEEVADIVYAVTNEAGKNRKEKSKKTYPKIKANPDAVIIKLADRLCHLNMGGNMGIMYRNELPNFLKELGVDESHRMYRFFHAK